LRRKTGIPLAVDRRMAFQTSDLPAAAPAIAGRARHVIFGFDELTWAAAQERGMFSPQDQLALALLDDPRVERLLICERPRSAPVKLIKDVVQRPVKFESSERARLWQPLRWRRHDPVSVPALERAYAAYDRHLRRAARRFGLERPAVITGQPFVAAFAGLDWAGPVTLFATDDLAAHPGYERWHPALRVAYERVAQRGRRVCAVSSAIVDRISPSGPAAVVPNGVDPAMWLESADPPRWFAELPGPRLFYVGTLDTRLDIEAIRAVARAWPQGSVVLVGPVVDEAHLAPALAEPNVVAHQSVPRDQVAALARAADACLLPHRQTPLTEAMSPLKLYEYLASGSPTVATDLEPVRRAEGRIFRVAPEGDFVAGVRTALAAGPADELERRRFVERNSWAHRSAEVQELALRL
jgi:glycosyltransferase involved in cell wall biosynthesis